MAGLGSCEIMLSCYDLRKDRVEQEGERTGRLPGLRASVCVRRVLLSAGYASPKKRRAPKHRSRRERRACEGAMVHLDGSQARHLRAESQRADGADWIWNEVRDHLPESIKIIDYRHASEHIHNLALALYGEGNPRGKRWAVEHCRRLLNKGSGSLLRAMKRRKPRNDEERKALRLEHGYFKKYRKHMNYPAYRARGMMIGSGPVQSACKVIVGQRLKQSGMRCTKGGADGLYADAPRFRTALHSNNW